MELLALAAAKHVVRPSCLMMQPFRGSGVHRCQGGTQQRCSSERSIADAPCVSSPIGLIWPVADQTDRYKYSGRVMRNSNSVRDLDGKVALVTGATSGIGQA